MPIYRPFCKIAFKKVKDVKRLSAPDGKVTILQCGVFAKLKYCIALETLGKCYALYRMRM